MNSIISELLCNGYIIFWNVDPKQIVFIFGSKYFFIKFMKNLLDNKLVEKDTGKCLMLGHCIILYLFLIITKQYKTAEWTNLSSTILVVN